MRHGTQGMRPNQYGLWKAGKNFEKFLPEDNKALDEYANPDGRLRFFYNGKSLIIIPFRCGYKDFGLSMPGVEVYFNGENFRVPADIDNAALAMERIMRRVRAVDESN